MHEYWESFIHFHQNEVYHFMFDHIVEFSLDDYGLLHSYNGKPSAIYKGNHQIIVWYHEHGSLHNNFGKSMIIINSRIQQVTNLYHIKGSLLYDETEYYDIIQKFLEIL